MKPVIKILKSGKSLSSTDIRDYLFHSDFSMLKYHMDSIVSMTINAGDTENIISVNHNLGYVPEFMAYNTEGTAIYELPNRTSTISGYDVHYSAYADSSKIYIRRKSSIPYNQEWYEPDQYWHEFAAPGAFVLVGNEGGNGRSTAVRFPYVSVNKNATILSATIEWIHCGSSSVSSNTKMKVFGLDYDNVGDVTVGLDRTSAYTQQEQAKLSGWFNFGSNVKSQVEKITTRSGWASGNRMGFTIENYESPTGAYILGGDDSTARLYITVSGSMTKKFRVIVFKDKIA